jgi:hypothetical protein
MSETEICLRPPETETSFIDWVEHSRSYLRTETDSSLRNVIFNYELRRSVISKKTVTVLALNLIVKLVQRKFSHVSQEVMLYFE